MNLTSNTTDYGQINDRDFVIREQEARKRALRSLI